MSEAEWRRENRRWADQTNGADPRFRRQRTIYSQEREMDPVALRTGWADDESKEGGLHQDQDQDQDHGHGGNAERGLPRRALHDPDPCVGFRALALRKGVGEEWVGARMPGCLG